MPRARLCISCRQGSTERTLQFDIIHLRQQPEQAVRNCRLGEIAMQETKACSPLRESTWEGMMTAALTKPGLTAIATPWCCRRWEW